MGRPQKNYEVDALPDLLVSAHCLIVRFENDPKPGRTFDFTEVEPAACATALAVAFRYQAAAASECTRITTNYSIRKFCEFLRETNRVAPNDIDSKCVAEFITWLGGRFSTNSARRSVWSRVKQLLRWLATTRPQWIAADLDLPFAPFPGVNAESARTRVLQRAEMERALELAQQEVVRSWIDFQTGQKLLAAADPTGNQPIECLDLKDLGTLLRLLSDRFGGRLPSSKSRILRRAIERHGGNARISRYLFATPDTLIPYLLLIAAQSFANTHALLGMRRDCLSDHLLFEHRVVLSWEKGRSSRRQLRSFLRKQPFGAPKLIDQVKALTEPLLSDLPAATRDLLFIAHFPTQPRGTRPLSISAMSNALKRFAERNGLTEPEAGTLRLNPSVTRATGLTLAHEAFGEDITKTRLVANHVSFETTQRYVAQKVVINAAARELSNLQEQFAGSVQQPIDSSAAREAPKTTANGTASGFDCRDPFAGAGPGQVTGEICTAWLGCFTCPNAVVPISVDVLARLEATREALLEAKMNMAVERWELLYAPKLMILEAEILPNFPRELAVDAAKLRSHLSPIPPIE